jgi:hypothetical protein
MIAARDDTRHSSLRRQLPIGRLLVIYGATGLTLNGESDASDELAKTRWRELSVLCRRP